MKYIAILLLLVLVILPACGQTPLQDKLSLSIATMHINNTQMDSLLGSPVGFNLGYKLTEEGNMQTGVSIGYFTATHDAGELPLGITGNRVADIVRPWDGLSMKTVPVMATQRWTFKQDSKIRPYLGYGIGFCWTQKTITSPVLADTGNVQGAVRQPETIDETTTHLTAAYQLVAGAGFGNGYFVDFKFIDGGQDVSGGYTINLGKSF